MSFTINLGWWLLPVTFTIIALLAMLVRVSRADVWDFSLLFIVPATVCAILFVWMAYFGIGWALA